MTCPAWTTPTCAAAGPRTTSGSTRRPRSSPAMRSWRSRWRFFSTRAITCRRPAFARASAPGLGLRPARRGGRAVRESHSAAEAWIEDLRAMALMKTGALLMRVAPDPARSGRRRRGEPAGSAIDAFGERARAGFQVADDLEDAAEDASRATAAPAAANSEKEEKGAGKAKSAAARSLALGKSRIPRASFITSTGKKLAR